MPMRFNAVLDKTLEPQGSGRVTEGATCVTQFVAFSFM